jgi:hypothetical protein
MTLEKALKELLIRDPFYGIFMLGLNKRVVSGDHEIQTAAVGLSGLNYTLYVHEDFWKKLTDPQQIAILKHECGHLLFFHLTDTFKSDYPTIMNIAMDQWSRYAVMYSCNC